MDETIAPGMEKICIASFQAAMQEINEARREDSLHEIKIFAPIELCEERKDLFLNAMLEMLNGEDFVFAEQNEEGILIRWI